MVVYSGGDSNGMANPWLMDDVLPLVAGVGVKELRVMMGEGCEGGWVFSSSLEGDSILSARLCIIRMNKDLDTTV